MHHKIQERRETIFINTERHQNRKENEVGVAQRKMEHPKASFFVYFSIFLFQTKSSRTENIEFTNHGFTIPLMILSPRSSSSKDTTAENKMKTCKER